MDQRKIRALRNVRRFNFEHCNRYQSVAEHSYFVAVLAMELAVRAMMPPPKVASVIEAALMHDVTEAVTGDIPYLVRRSMDRVALAEIEHRAANELKVDASYPLDVIWVVDYADALELAMYLKEERESGNRSLIDIERETRRRLVDVDAGGEPSAFYSFAVSILGGPEEWELIGTKEMPHELKH